MSVVGHVKAALSFVFITLNLIVWIVPLAALALVRLVSKDALTRRAMAAIYRVAVALDDAWLALMGARWRVSGEPVVHLDRDAPVLVISNHRSWADIFVIQSVIARQGPIVVFLAKRELAWIPILGVIFLALEFPILRRPSTSGDDASRREGDMDRVVAACRRLRDAPAALLSFAEGTRLTEAKRLRKPGYAHLLPPRRGGIEAYANAIPASKVVDLTLIYRGDSSFWRFLAGCSGGIDVDIDIVDLPTADAGDWINERWRRKDAILARETIGSARGA